MSNTPLILLGFYIIEIISIGVGWIINIINIIGIEEFSFTGKLIVGIIGVFVPPIGGIMGLFVW